MRNEIAWRSSRGYFLSTLTKFGTTIVAMSGTFSALKFEKARLIILPSLLAAFIGFLLSTNTSPPAQAFSNGPPPGYTGAPGEEPEACAECHVPVGDPPLGQISISVPPTYVPGQTYTITVTNSNADNTRRRWGFELTALDPSDERAGNLQSTDGLTQVLNNAGPGGERQYIEHSPSGTFIGQMDSAWTFIGRHPRRMWGRNFLCAETMQYDGNVRAILSIELSSLLHPLQVLRTFI